MRDDRPTPRQQLLLAVVIGALALAGSIGMVRAGRSPCALAPGSFGPRGVPIAPIGTPPPTTVAP